MSKTLVACFSPTGNTQAVADIIATETGADKFVIKPVEPYSAADLDWHNDKSRSSIEMKDKAARPPLGEAVPDLTQYDTIYLGFPIWWYEAPRIIATFLESGNFSGKKIISFVTSGSSGLGDTPAILKNLCPSANWQNGKRFSEKPSQKEVLDWVKSL